MKKRRIQEMDETIITRKIEKTKIRENERNTREEEKDQQFREMVNNSRRTAWN